MVQRQRSSILLLTFARNPSELEDALMTSSPAQAAVEAGWNIKPLWANGAKILVPGISLGDLEPPTILNELRPWHVVLLAQDEDALFESLEQLPCNIKKLRPGYGQLLLPDVDSLFMASLAAETSTTSESVVQCSREAETPEHLPVERTFIHFKDSSDTRTIRSAWSPDHVLLHFASRALSIESHFPHLTICIAAHGICTASLLLSCSRWLMARVGLACFFLLDSYHVADGSCCCHLFR